MTYYPTNYLPNEQSYYSFPAYRAVVGSQTQGTMPLPNPSNNQGFPPQATAFTQMQATVAATPPAVPAGTPILGVPTTLPAPTIPGLAPIEQSYIENILRFNLGKVGTFYMTYENNSQWNAKVFKGKIEAAGRDHIIISDSKTGMRFLLLMVNLDYVTFDEELKYTSPYQQGNRS
ncbi:MAG: spore coat protein GerQ [Paenibacillaceae bacterium]